MDPILSIIIPVYNRQKTFDRLSASLEKAILFADALLDVEIIVVDDHSKEPVSISCLPDQTKLIRNDRNQGAPFSRQKGFKYSRGEFIHFHDSDDFFHIDWIDKIISAFRQDQMIDILVTGRAVIDDNGKRRFVYQKFLDAQAGNLQRIHKRLVYRNCLGPLGGVTFTRRVVQEMTFKSLASCQDWHMYIECLPSVKRIASRPDILFYFNTASIDRISKSPRKKLLGHLQLSRTTMTTSFFGKSLRLFYLMTWRVYLKEMKTCGIRNFYKNNYFNLWVCYCVISLYWRLR